MLRIIDGLTYLGRDLTCQEYQFSTPESLNAVLGKYRMSGALVCSFACSTLDAAYGNETLFKMLAGNRKLSSCPAVIPSENGKSGAEGKYLDGLIEKGVRFCCMFHENACISFDRRVIGPLCAALERRRLPMALFSADMIVAANLAKTYPRLPILLHKPSLRNRNFMALFTQTPNLCFSTAAGYSHYRGLELLSRKNGADKIFFASGYPISEPGAAIANLLYSDLTETARNKIASGNIERLTSSVKTGSRRRKAKIFGLAAPDSNNAPTCGSNSFVWRRQPVSWNGIVDMHAHYGKWREFPIWGGVADDLVDEMDRIGVSKIIVSHEACMTPEVIWGNDQVLAAMKKYPDRIAGYAACYPINKELGVGEIVRCIKAGMTGVKLHNGNGIAYTDSRCQGVWQYADKLRLPVIMHTGGDLASYEQIFEKYRCAPILLGHSGCADPESYVKFAQKYSNLYLEICFSSAPYGLVEYFVREVGADRILYGSDAPWLSMPHQLGRVLFADISETDKKKILVENPKRILKGIRRE